MTHVFPSSPTDAWPVSENSEPRRPAGHVRASVSGPSKTSRRPTAPLPCISPLLLRWFLWSAAGYVRKHFHTIRLGNSPALPTAHAQPLVLCCNQASWWDPLTCAGLQRRLLAPRRAFAPIDARMLDRYRMFRRLGFFGVEQGSARGATQFLRTAQAILAAPGTALWITPQGRFADVRERPLRLQSGLGHLAQRAPHAAFIPVAIEYAFWEERRPEILVRFGPPVQAGPTASAAQWDARLTTALGETQEALAHQSIRRAPADFQVLLAGRRGVNFIYDTWRRLRAGLRGEAFNPEHGAK